MVVPEVLPLVIYSLGTRFKVQMCRGVSRRSPNWKIAISAQTCYRQPSSIMLIVSRTHAHAGHVHNPIEGSAEGTALHPDSLR